MTLTLIGPCTPRANNSCSGSPVRGRPGTLRCRWRGRRAVAGDIRVLMHVKGASLMTYTGAVIIARIEHNASGDGGTRPFAASAAANVLYDCKLASHSSAGVLSSAFL